MHHFGKGYLFKKPLPYLGSMHMDVYYGHFCPIFTATCTIRFWHWCWTLLDPFTPPSCSTSNVATLWVHNWKRRQKMPTWRLPGVNFCDWSTYSSGKHWKNQMVNKPLRQAISKGVTLGGRCMLTSHSWGVDGCWWMSDDCQVSKGWPFASWWWLQKKTPFETNAK